MKQHVKTLDTFLNEGIETPKNENPLLEAEVYVSDDKIKDPAALEADILNNIVPAFNKLLADNKVPYKIDKAVINRGRVEFVGRPITGKDLGIMQWGIKNLWINSFGGGTYNVQKVTSDEEKFGFSPLIWFNLHYSYEHGSAETSSQGSNGCSLYLPGEKQSNIYYDIVNTVFLKASEADKLHR